MPQRDVQAVASKSAAGSGEHAHRSAAPWRAALPPLLLLIVLTVVLYRDTATSMVTIWYRSETFTHGFVVLPITLWLIWRRRQSLAVLQPRPGNYLLVVVIGLALMWLLGDLVAVNSITQLAFVAMLVASVPVVLGVPVAATIAFPLAFMFFAVPIGEFIMPQLMDWTAEFTILALRFTGIPVYREGLNFVIPSGSWSVVEACSGVRYLIASLTVGTLYAYLNYQSTRRRLLFILVSIFVPIVANWLRAYMIVMLGHYSGNTIAVGVDHLIYGWVFFGIVIFLMFMIGARWAEPDSVVMAPQQSAMSTNGVLPSTSRFWFSALVFAAIVSLPMFVKTFLESATQGAAPRLELSDSAFGSWSVNEVGAIGFKPSFKNSSAELNRVYVNGGQSVGIYLGYYRNQDYDHKLVTSTNVLVGSSDRTWAQIESGSVSVPLGGGSKQFRVAELRRLGAPSAELPEKLLVWRIYWVQGRLTSNDYLAKVYSAVYQLLGRGDDSAVLVLYTPLQSGNDAQATLAAFLSSGFGAIDKALTTAAQDGHK